MHSKVIVASLVCMLAASFGAGNKITSAIKQTNYKAENNVCLAPNDDGGNLEFVNPMIAVGDECRAIFSCGDTINSARVVKSTTGITVNFAFVGDDIRVCITTNNRTKPNQAVAISFNVGMKKLASRTITRTIYIHVEDGVSCYSALSYSDAKTMYFMNYVATADQLAELANGSPSFEGESSGFDLPDDPYDPDPGHPDPWPPFPPIPDPNPPRVGKSGLRAGRFDPGEPSFLLDPLVPTAEQTYIDYIFGDTQDMTFTVDLVSKDGLPVWAQRAGTGLHAQVNWYDENNNVRPAQGTSVQFYANGEVLTDFGHIFSQGPMSYDYRTGQTGYCTVDVMSDARLNVLEARVCADSFSTRVEDRFNIDYPFFARATDSFLSLPISDYAEITFTINIYQKKSERGKAFAMSQMQNVPYNYADEFTPNGVTAVETEFPAAKTFYDGANDTIFVQEQDYKSWDVLTHEYGHYIADKLNLCYIPTERMDHKVYQDLTVAYGDSVGKQLAYAEGLATYLGLASQMYYASEYSDAAYGDEIYKDQLRNLNVNYNNYRLGNSSYANPDGVEARNTSVLIKLLDDVTRPNDYVALGHQNMFDCIRAAGGASANIHSLVAKVAEQFPTYANGVYEITDAENIPDLSEDRWTIMVYASGGDYGQDALMHAIYEMLAAEGQPADVNVIIEAGGARYWPEPGDNVNLHDPANPLDIQLSATALNRLYIKNGQLRVAQSAPQANMGTSATFEDFLNWGLNEFPADKYGVILWDRDGRGMNGVCFDEINMRHDPLLASEIHTALENVFEDNDIQEKFEFIGYDACRMQVQDIAELNSDFFNYMVASQNCRTFDGWEYDAFLEDVYHDEDTETILRTVVDTYFVGDGINNESAMSVLDLNMMEDYVDALDTYLAKVAANMTSTHYLINDAIYHLQGTIESTYDVYGVMTNLLASINYDLRPADFNAYSAAFNNLVVYSRATQNYDFNGLSCYIPEVYENYPASETRLTTWRNLFSD